MTFDQWATHLQARLTGATATLHAVGAHLREMPPVASFADEAALVELRRGWGLPDEPDPARCPEAADALLRPIVEAVASLRLDAAAAVQQADAAFQRFLDAPPRVLSSAGAAQLIAAAETFQR